MRALAKRALPGIIYPGTMALAVGAYLGLLQRDAHLVFSTYFSLAIAFLVVIFFERWTPHRREWKADRTVQGQDLLFMTLIHLLFTKFLAFAAALAILAWFGEGRESAAFWPHDWPVAVQGLLMVVIVDFFRYWLHRACHENRYLWRLHAVHHSPKQLYWLNVGRFHPAERALQFLIDSVPFMLIGVSKEVLAMYFLFFAVNGVFQHCNIRLNYGFLNYLVSSAEMHRWHHSRVAAESNANYSNTTIIWDMAFGTRFLPAGREVGELGLANDRYPKDFLSQMKTPFIGGMEVKDVPLISFREVLVNALLRIKMRVVRLTAYRDLVRAARRPQACQRKVLMGILAANKDTAFGIRHGFADIGSEEAFRERVPVQEYEDLRPYVEEQERSGLPQLTRESPVMYNQTSGTTGTPKYVPVLKSGLERSKRLQKLFACIQYAQCPEGFQGKLLGLVSPAIEGRLASGKPFGSASGLIYRSMPRLARAKYVLPYEVFEIADYGIKYYLIVRLALAEKRITYLGSANPSTFFKMLEVMAENRKNLLEDIRCGTAKHLDLLEPRIAVAIRDRLKADPARARELEPLFADPSKVDFESVWPYVRIVTTWTGGSCGMAIAKLKSRLPDEAMVFELGFLASEFRGTVTVDGKTGEGVPTLEDNYFEFVEKEAREQGRSRFLGMGELEVGKDYYVFVTTPAGLYRYDMNDIVRVGGRFGNAPTLRFLQKGKGVTNITGEKLYESQVLEAVRQAEADEDLKVHFFQMLADEDAFRYELFMEAEIRTAEQARGIARRVDAYLQAANLEYRTKRGSDRLKPMALHVLKPGASEAYKRHFLAKGQREVQFKPMPLQYAKNLEMDLKPWSLPL